MDYAMRIPCAERCKGYVHFDERVTYRKVQKCVEDPEFVKKHAFYPLLYTEIDSATYHRDPHDGSKKILSSKNRPIAYASHLDHRIYQYYSLLWGDRYEEELRSRGCGCSVIAYRHGKHLSSITGASGAFNSIKKMGNALVIVGDFSSFFDNLDHKYLLKSMRTLFDNGSLPEDHFRVLRSVLKYSYWPLDDLLDRCGLNRSTPEKRKASIKRFNRNRKTALSPEEFRKYKNRCIVVPWRESGHGRKGIPQGLAVSGVLSNIYMLECDSGVYREVVTKRDGWYGRYCDDFIIVLPWDKREAVSDVMALLGSIPGVTLNPEKTKLYHVHSESVETLDENLSVTHRDKKIISFLGFEFDGLSVRLRGKTVSRFFNRYYRTVRRLNRRRYIYGRISKERVTKAYRSFSKKGDERRLKGYRHNNFLSYVARAQHAFPYDPISKPFENMYRRLKRDLGRSK